MLRKLIWVSVAILCLVCGSMIPTASGQAVYGGIAGTVTDPQGAGVGGAKVVVTNLTKGTTDEATTNENGNYTVTHLITDNYKIRGEAAGFKSFEITNVPVCINPLFHADLTRPAATLHHSVS